MGTKPDPNKGLSVIQTDQYRIERRAAAGGRTIVAFSTIHMRPGHFSFYRQTDHLADVNRVFVSDLTDGWYQAGIPGLGARIDDVASGLRTILEDLESATVYTTGFSMGGYAALLFGALLKARRTVAFGAETYLKLPHSRSDGFMGDRASDPAYIDLRPFLAAGDYTTDAILFCGEFDVVDQHSARRVGDLPRLRVQSVADTEHGVPAFFDRSGSLRALFSGLVAEDAFDPSVFPNAGNLAQDSDGIDRWYDGFQHLKAHRWSEAENALSAFLAAHPENAAAQDHLGQALVAQKRLDEAVVAFTKAVRRMPEHANLLRRLGRVQERLGRTAESADWYRQADLLDPPATGAAADKRLPESAAAGTL